MAMQTLTPRFSNIAVTTCERYELLVMKHNTIYCNTIPGQGFRIQAIAVATACIYNDDILLMPEVDLESTVWRPGYCTAVAQLLGRQQNPVRLLVVDCTHQQNLHTSRKRETKH